MYVYKSFSFQGRYSRNNPGGMIAKVGDEIVSDDKWSCMVLTNKDSPDVDFMTGQNTEASEPAFVSLYFYIIIIYHYYNYYYIYTICTNHFVSK